MTHTADPTPITPLSQQPTVTALHCIGLCFFSDPASLACFLPATGTIMHKRQLPQFLLSAALTQVTT